MGSFFENLLSLLRVRSAVAGLTVSDHAVRLVYFNEGAWRLHAIRLAPGVIERGVLRDRDAFVGALVELKAESNIVGKNLKKNVNVAVVLDSATSYNKVFRLPELKGQELDKAISLNVEMASPAGTAEMYSDWQVAGHDTGAGQIEVLSAFIEHSAVDAVVDALISAGYMTMSIESKALALARVFRQKGSGIDIQRSYVLVVIDGDGMEFLVVRNGQLYFEYKHQWSEIMDAKGDIPLPAFEDELKSSLHQVLNFYAQQWPEPLAAIVLSAVAFNDEVEKVIAENVTVPAVRLTLVMGQPISSEWLAALGCSLRGAIVGENKEINFLGGELADGFRRAEAVSFLDFWRVVVPLTLGILVCAFVAMSIFFGHTRSDIELTPGYTLIPQQSAQLAGLVASSSAFNNEVVTVQLIENSGGTPLNAVLGDVQALAAKNGVGISRMTASGGTGATISLSGTASSGDDISSFKIDMSQDPHISRVDLPLTEIQQTGGNHYSFQMTFVYVP